MPAPTRKTHQLIIEDIMAFKARANVSYIDSVLEYCTSNNIEPEAIVKIIKSSKSLINMIKGEAVELHFLKRTADAAEE